MSKTEQTQLEKDRELLEKFRTKQLPDKNEYLPPIYVANLLAAQERVVKEEVYNSIMPEMKHEFDIIRDFAGLLERCKKGED